MDMSNEVTVRSAIEATIEAGANITAAAEEVGTGWNKVIYDLLIS